MLCINCVKKFVTDIFEKRNVKHYPFVAADGFRLSGSISFS